MKILRRGMSGEEVAGWQQRLEGEYRGAIDGQFGPATEAATVRAQVKRRVSATGVVGELTRLAVDTSAPIPEAKLTQRERALIWCLEEHALVGRLPSLERRSQPHPHPNTSLYVASILGPCVREIDGELKPLGLRVGNWCMAWQSAALEAVRREDENVPHLYRAAVVEAVEDARLQDRFFPIEDVFNGLWPPEPGDLAIWDRRQRDASGKIVPGTEWFRHVNRVVHYDTMNTITLSDDVFSTVGGNESRAIMLTTDRPKQLTAGMLMGFICCRERRPSDPEHVLTDEERNTLAAETTAARAAIAREAVRQSKRDMGEIND